MNSINISGVDWFIALLFNFFLILFAQKAPVLTNKGWLHAGALGTILLGGVGWNAWLAVVSYLVLGYAVTKIGYKFKNSLGIAESRGGKRGPENVWGSAATGTFMVLMISLGFEPIELLLLGFSASFVAKLGDTFGSEIGKRWGKKTYLITSFQLVPNGTEGAISIEGTLASLFGCLLMASIMASLSLLQNFSFFLIAILSGFIATIGESFLGATIQNRITWLNNELINAVQTSFACLLSILIAFLIS